VGSLGWARFVVPAGAPVAQVTIRFSSGDPEPGLWYITLVGTGGYNRVQLNVQFFAVGAEPPAIGQGGVVLATQTPPVFGVSPNSIISIYGEDFVPEGVVALQPELDGEGKVATRLAETCVEIDGKRAPLFAVLAGQINAQVPEDAGPWFSSVVVIRGCETGDERRSDKEPIFVFRHSPGFFNFVNNADGVNPLAAVHGGGPDFAGAPGLFPGVVTTPARPGEYISLFGTGFGPTEPPLAAGEIPARRYPELQGQVPLADELRLLVGGVEVPSGDISYAGAAPCCAGLYQFVFKIPTTAGTGNLPVVAVIGDDRTGDGPYITVAGEE